MMRDPGDPEISGAPETVGAFLHEFECPWKKLRFCPPLDEIASLFPCEFFTLP